MTRVGSDIVQRVRAILPVIEASRAEADATARLAPAARKAGDEAGIFRLYAPVECGGPGATYPEILQVLEDLAAGDPTVAWHVGNSSGVANTAAFLPEAERQALLDGTTGPFGFCGIIGGTLTPTEGGYVLEGRWPFLTGALDASRAALMASVATAPADAPDFRLCLVPSEAWTVERTWDSAAAMRGTGSHAVVVHNAFVPDLLAHDIMRPALLDAPLYRLPIPSSGQLVAAPVALGIARRVLEETTTTLSTHVVRADGVALRDKSRMQREIASASVEVDVLHAGLHALATSVWEAACAGRDMSEFRGPLWSMLAFVLDRCRELVGRLAALTSSSFYSQGNRVEAGLRDVHALAAAMEVFRDLHEAHGRVLLGLEPNNPVY